MFRFLLFIILIGITGPITATEIVANATISEENPTKSYTKTYYDSGALKAEGWEMGDIKVGYWYFYAENGALQKEGHYNNGEAENWWIFHDIANQTTTKFQLKNNKKNGYALCYYKDKLKRVEQYKDDIEIDSWTSIFAFRRDNPNVSF